MLEIFLIDQYWYSKIYVNYSPFLSRWKEYIPGDDIYIHTVWFWKSQYDSCASYMLTWYCSWVVLIESNDNGKIIKFNCTQNERLTLSLNPKGEECDW